MARTGRWRAICVQSPENQADDGSLAVEHRQSGMYRIWCLTGLLMIKGTPGCYTGLYRLAQSDCTYQAVYTVLNMQADLPVYTAMSWLAETDWAAQTVLSKVARDVKNVFAKRVFFAIRRTDISVQAHKHQGLTECLTVLSRQASVNQRTAHWFKTISRIVSSSLCQPRLAIVVNW